MIPQFDKSSYRMEQQFSQDGSRNSTYKMAKQPSAKGVVQTASGRQRNILKRRKNRFRSLVMLTLVAFIMLSPQAKEALFGEFGGVEEFFQSQLAPYHIYPNEAVFTLSKNAQVSMTGSPGTGSVTENILIPPMLRSSLVGTTQFSHSGGQGDSPSVVMQETLAITMVIAGESISVPKDGLPVRSYANRITTAAGHEVWWPNVGVDDDECPMAKCVKIKVNVQTGQQISYAFQVKVKSVSYSWWDDGRVDARIAGRDIGINVENSGTFDDIAARGNGVRQVDFGTPKWYDRGSNNFAINGEDGLVRSAADTIASSLPEGSSENVYAFARATFDYLHAFISYDKNAPVTARSGPDCLAANTGDCDEQTNAFFSILRTRGVPGWYAFGVLGDPYLSSEGWEAHAWGYVQLPLSDEWCEERNIILQSCYVEAQVDVVNNKWLLATPTAYLDWVEYADSSGNAVYEYYHPVRSVVYEPGASIDRQRSFETIGDVVLSGGSYKVKKYPEIFA